MTPDIPPDPSDSGNHSKGRALLLERELDLGQLGLAWLNYLKKNQWPIARALRLYVSLTSLTVRLVALDQSLFSLGAGPRALVSVSAAIALVSHRTRATDLVPPRALANKGLRNVVALGTTRSCLKQLCAC